MKKVKYVLKSLTSSVLALIIFSYASGIARAEMNEKVTFNKPGMVCTKQESIKDDSGGGSEKWLWAITAGVLVAGIAALAGGSSGSDNGSDSSSTGTVAARW